MGGPIVETQARDAQRRGLELLLRVGELLAESLDYRSAIQNVCAAVVEEFADICLLHLGSLDSLHLAAAAHRDPDRNAGLHRAGEYLVSDVGFARHHVRAVMTTREPLLVPIVTDEYLRANATSPSHERFMREMDYASLMTIPLVSAVHGILGTLCFVRTNAELPFSESDLAFARDLGRRCATAIGKAMLYDQTQRISTLFQRAALPHALPSVPGIAFDAFYEPSSEDVLVGGDWYDAFVLPDRRIVITVGDVLGHGIEAAVWMSRLRNSLRASLYTDPDPVRSLVVADHLIRLESDDSFSTALIAIVDPVHQTLSVASAGHPGPMIFERDGTITDRFEERSLPLGLRYLGTGPTTAQMITLRPGTFAAFFTDGLLEWNRDVAASWELMKTALARQDVREAARPALMLRDAVIGNARHQDDVAILTLRIDELLRRELRD